MSRNRVRPGHEALQRRRQGALDRLHKQVESLSKNPRMKDEKGNPWKPSKRILQEIAILENVLHWRTND